MTVTPTDAATTHADATTSDGVVHRVTDPAVLAQETCGWTVEQWLRVDARRTYRITRAMVEWWLRLGWRLRYYGSERVPMEGETLVCPNHSSWLDGWMQALGHRRIPRWMGKREVIDNRLIGTYLRNGGVFPVHRGRSDGVAIDIARLALEDGQHVVVYAEGTRIRKPGGVLGEPRSGAARLALATGAQVLPIGQYGMKPGTGREYLPTVLRWLPLARRVTVVYGETFRVPREAEPSPERVVEVRDLIWRHVTAVYETARVATCARVRPRDVVIPVVDGSSDSAN